MMVFALVFLFMKNKTTLMNDILINWLGFIPLGACFYGIILSLHSPGIRTILIAVACAVLVSLGIELLQAFIPTRSSQFIDVVFNGLGAWTGAIFVHLASVCGNSDGLS
jgi:VanZ family protein